MFAWRVWEHAALNPVAYQASCKETDLTGRWLKRLARPEGLEPPAYWFEAIAAPRINTLLYC
jgi:hypothetical protein